MDFDFAVDRTQTEGNGGSHPDVDFDALMEYKLKALGGEGKHDFIGVVTRLDQLGLQQQDRQTVVWDDKAKAEHAWRFELNDKGEVKDPSAHIEDTVYGGKVQECLIYSRKPAQQVAVSVDFPEVMLDIGQFYGDESGTLKPFREIIGSNGFLPKFKLGKGKVIAKPFNLTETNVNRQKKDAKAYYAIAKNSKLHSMAEWAGVLDDEENIKAAQLGKLIGQPMNFEVDVKIDEWEKDGNTNRRLKVDIMPVSKLSVRDRKAYDEELADLIKPESFGVVQFNAANKPEFLKDLRKETINTMKMALNFDESVIKGELEEAGKLKEDTPKAPKQAAEPAKPKEDKVVQQAKQMPAQDFKEPPMDFDDSIPF